MNQIKIKIFSSFTSSKNCKETFERINCANECVFYGINNKYYITEDDDYTHAIIINTAMPTLKIPKENVLGLAFEPILFLELNQEFIEYAKNHIGKYFIGDKHHLPKPFVEHFAYMWYIKPPKEIPLKKNIMSIVLSRKQFAPGHIFRHEIVKKIIELNLPIDIYGRGSTMYKYNRIMGEFQYTEPFDNYLFSICIENIISNHYFSEKVINPIMLNCNPIYLGCKNIDNYLENVIKLTGNISQDIDFIKKILNTPNMYYKKTYTVKNVKNVNLIQNLPNVFS